MSQWRGSPFAASNVEETEAPVLAPAQGDAGRAGLSQGPQHRVTRNTDRRLENRVRICEGQVSPVLAALTCKRTDAGTPSPGVYAAPPAPHAKQAPSPPTSALLTGSSSFILASAKRARPHQRIPAGRPARADSGHRRSPRRLRVSPPRVSPRRRQVGRGSACCFLSHRASVLPPHVTATQVPVSWSWKTRSEQRKRPVPVIACTSFFCPLLSSCQLGGFFC